MTKIEDMLSPSEAARAAGISVEYIRRLMKSGKLPCTETSLGRLVRREDVAALVEARRERPTSYRRPHPNRQPPG